MAYELHEGEGSLFKNDKRANDRQPQYTGTIRIGGETKRIAAWVKRSKNGLPYMGLQISDFDNAPAQPQPQPQQHAPASQQNVRQTPPPPAPAEDGKEECDLPFK